METTVNLSIAKTLMYIPFVAGWLWVCEYLHLNCELMILLMVTMCFDFVAGWFKSIALEIPITLKRLVIGFYSKVMTFIILLLLGVITAAVDIQYPTIVEGMGFKEYISGVILVMILSESYSVYGNIQAARTGEEVKEIDFISMFIRGVRKKLAKFLSED